MLLRDPQPYPEFMQKFDQDTAVEIPAIHPQNRADRPDTTRVPFMLDTVNPCPYWHAPEPKPRLDISKLDYEKLAGRVLLIGMGTFTLLISLILLYKVLILVILFK